VRWRGSVVNDKQQAEGDEAGGSHGLHASSGREPAKEVGPS
jgi:hypothetical protein